MKKVVFVAICVFGIMCFSSCRSTSKSCGLAENESPTIVNKIKQTSFKYI